MKTLKAFQSGDGAHRGLGDWYPDKERALKRALKSQRPFDTGWYGSKKEIASARISSEDGFIIMVEASVSDDFDTEGVGTAIAPSNKIEDVRQTIYKAWDEAEKDQKSNRQYAGYSIHLWSTKIPNWAWRNGKFCNRNRRVKRKQPRCIDYYIVNRSEWGMDAPPGDNYHYWGWQESEDDGQTPSFNIPKRIAQKFEDHANSLKSESLRIGDWEIKPWGE